MDNRPDKKRFLVLIQYLTGATTLCFRDGAGKGREAGVRDSIESYKNQKGCRNIPFFRTI
ncbi:hypothetical protein CF114_04050 [Aeromonas veronii]|nr:hypothetical protein CF114_04050 [Aeromonas veronii]